MEDVADDAVDDVPVDAPVDVAVDVADGEVAAAMHAVRPIRPAALTAPVTTRAR